MKLLFTSSNALVVSHLGNLLEAAGMASRTKNEFLYSAAGEIPPTETWPELWVEEADYAVARKLITEALADKSHLPGWWCQGCGELVEGQFALCWNCGASRPDEPY